MYQKPFNRVGTKYFHNTDSFFLATNLNTSSLATPHSKIFVLTLTFSSENVLFYININSNSQAKIFLSVWHIK